MESISVAEIERLRDSTLSIDHRIRHAKTLLDRLHSTPVLNQRHEQEMVSAVFDWLVSVVGASKRAKKKRKKPPAFPEENKSSTASDDVWSALPIELYWECLGLVCELSKGIAQAEAMMIVWGPRMIQYIPNLVAQKAKSALKHADKALKSVFSLWKPQVEVLATLLLTLYKSLEAEQEQEQGVDSGLDQLLATTVGSLEEKIANAASGKKIFASLVPKILGPALSLRLSSSKTLTLSCDSLLRSLLFPKDNLAGFVRVHVARGWLQGTRLESEKMDTLHVLYRSFFTCFWGFMKPGKTLALPSSLRFLITEFSNSYERVAEVHEDRLVPFGFCLMLLERLLSELDSAEDPSHDQLLGLFEGIKAIKDTKAYKPAQDKLVSSAADDGGDGGGGGGGDGGGDDGDSDGDVGDVGDVGDGDGSEPKKLLPQLSFLSRIRETVEKLSDMQQLESSKRSLLLQTLVQLYRLEPNIYASDTMGLWSTFLSSYRKGIATSEHHGSFLAQAQSILCSLIDVFGESQQVEELVTSLNKASNSLLSSIKDVPTFHGLLESEPVTESVIKAAKNSLLAQVVPIMDCVVEAACQSTLAPSALGVFLSQVLTWLPVNSTNARLVYRRVADLKVKVMDVVQEADSDSHHFVGTLHVLMALESLRRMSAAFDPCFGTEFDLQAIDGQLVAAMGPRAAQGKAKGEGALAGSKKKRKRSQVSQSDSIEETNFRTRLRRAVVIYNSFGLSDIGYLDPAAPRNSNNKAKYASGLFQAATRPELQACLDLWASRVEPDVLIQLVEQAISDFVHGADTTHLIFDNPTYFDIEILRKAFAGALAKHIFAAAKAASSQLPLDVTTSRVMDWLKNSGIGTLSRKTNKNKNKKTRRSSCPAREDGANIVPDSRDSAASLTRLIRLVRLVARMPRGLFAPQEGAQLLESIACAEYVSVEKTCTALWVLCRQCLLSHLQALNKDGLARDDARVHGIVFDWMVLSARCAVEGCLWDASQEGSSSSSSATMWANLYQALSLARHSGQLAGDLNTATFIERALEWRRNEEGEHKTQGGGDSGSEMSKAWFLSWMAGLLESTRREKRVAAPSGSLGDDEDEDSSPMDRLVPLMISVCSDILASCNVKDNSSRIAIETAFVFLTALHSSLGNTRHRHPSLDSTVWARAFHQAYEILLTSTHDSNLGTVGACLLLTVQSTILSQCLAHSFDRSCVSVLKLSASLLSGMAKKAIAPSQAKRTIVNCFKPFTTSAQGRQVIDVVMDDIIGLVQATGSSPRESSSVDEERNHAGLIFLEALVESISLADADTLIPVSRQRAQVVLTSLSLVARSQDRVLSLICDMLRMPKAFPFSGHDLAVCLSSCTSIVQDLPLEPDSIRIAALCVKILATSLHYRRRETSRQMAVISGCINLTLKWISVAVGGGQDMAGATPANSNNNNKQWEELAQNIADVYRQVEARKEALNRYALFLLSDLLQYMVSFPGLSALPTPAQAILRQGAFLLMDACSKSELQELHSSVSGNDDKRLLLQGLRHDYQSFHKYVGKV